MCHRCWSEVRRLEDPLCRRCGVELPSARKDCGCRGRLRSLARLRSAVAYEGPIEHAVHRFKYEGWRRLAGPLAQLVAERLVVEGLAARCVVAVPLHPDRLHERGFNQAELLAGELRRRLAIFEPAGKLVRTRPTPPQVGNDRLRRFENGKDASYWQGPGIGGEAFFLLDYVATPGPTLHAGRGVFRGAARGQ